jgi:hypothetical protein
MSTRTLFAHLPPPAESFALLIGTLELLPFGIIGLLHPASFADGYGLPITNTPPSTSTSSSSNSTKNPTSTSTKHASDPDSDSTKEALIAALAARNIQNGVLLLTFGIILRDRRSLGVTVLAGLVATVADTVIVRRYGVREKIWGHLIGVVNSVAVGGSLLYWGRGDRIW